MNFEFTDIPYPEEMLHQQYLRQIAGEGVRRLYDVEDLVHPKNNREKFIATRFCREVEIIEQAGLEKHFLLIWDLIRAVKGMGISVGPGCGPAPGSLLAYSLGITGIDPLRHGLIFERFLNPERMSRPNIIIDVCSRRRGEVVDYMKRKYGEDCVDQNLPSEQSGTSPLSQNIDAACDSSRLKNPGSVKVEIFGLKVLTVIREICDRVMQEKSHSIDPQDFPLDDPKTYEMLARGDAEGVFQLESAGIRERLRDLQVNKIEELIAMIALHRPGPMKMIPNFIKRKHGRKSIAYLHPLLEPILKETYGVMVYQEQLQQAVCVLAGFSMGQGDILRRELGKKNPPKVAIQREAFVKKCIMRKTSNLAKAEQLFDYFARNACYLFNKSHAVAYGFLTFQTAYLKANYPAQFMEVMQSIGANCDDWWRDRL